MGFVAFVVAEKGKETSAATLHVDPPSGPDEFSRAVDDLVSRKALDDAQTAQMIAGHFAEVALSALLDDDDDRAERAANALLAVLREPYVMVRADRLRGDIEISEIVKITAGSEDEAEDVFTATIERMLPGITPS